MEILTGITPYIVLVFAVAALAVALAAGATGVFLLRNRALRVRAGLPVRVYYRHLAWGH
ncbi:hypothetical protein [Intrasporangium oryzae]|uniref:hypothetical protein n=1 Tax=Intrasporangium oryzae TaxID=412687 RepID=UPI0004ADDB5A|nr:hypothetical protein [Intrasporangium oryzae]